MELGARSQIPCVIIILQGEQAPVISQSELSFLLEGHDTLLIKIYQPFVLIQLNIIQNSSSVGHLLRWMKKGTERNNSAIVLTHSEFELIERVEINLFQFDHHHEGKLGHSDDIFLALPMLVPTLTSRLQARCGHVRTPYCLNLLYV